jgi:hypothetical protein
MNKLISLHKNEWMSINNVIVRNIVIKDQVRKNLRTTDNKRTGARPDMKPFNPGACFVFFSDLFTKRHNVRCDDGET